MFNNVNVYVDEVAHMDHHRTMRDYEKREDDDNDCRAQ